MANNFGGKQNDLVAKLVTGKKSCCVFCNRKIDNEVIYGKLYAIGDIQCHYFCVLLSCCLVQKGEEEEGLFGFLYKDILAEVTRSKKHKCSYCNQEGATLGCSVVQCKKQFHLPCGREKNAISLFYGNYKSFCEKHAPKQKIPDEIMCKAKKRMLEYKAKSSRHRSRNKEETARLELESVCVVCYEFVEAYPSVNTFWPPCCARDAWLHRSCLQRMALSAGMHYLKCPLCNDKDIFYKAIVMQGYYVPDRDAAWELEQNAFAEIYERPLFCSVTECFCPLGRDHDAEQGPWDIKLCLLCGSVGIHAQCLFEYQHLESRYVCSTCQPVAPDDMDSFHKKIEKMIQEEVKQENQVAVNRPLMSSRMSLRRTKRRREILPSSSSSPNLITTTIKVNQAPINQTNTQKSRQELNLNSPKKFARNIENLPKADISLSPMKILKIGNLEDMGEHEIVERIKESIKKPRPFSKKKKIIKDLLKELLKNKCNDSTKHRELLREWISPKKSSETNKTEIDGGIKIINIERSSASPIHSIEQTNSLTPSKSDEVPLVENHAGKENPNAENDVIVMLKTPVKLKTINIEKDSSLEIYEKNEIININLLKVEDSSADIEKGLTSKCALKIFPENEELEDENVNVDVKKFHDMYLNEVDKTFKCSYNHKHLDIEYDKKLRTAIDFAVEAFEKKGIKRKEENINDINKRKRTDEYILKSNEDNIKMICLDKTKKKKKKRKTCLSIRNKNVHFKIKWKKEELNLKISESKHKDKLKNKYRRQNINQQLVLKYDNGDSNNFKAVKPEKEVLPLRRKFIKQVKSPDNLKQTTLNNFFKAKSKDN